MASHDHDETNALESSSGGSTQTLAVVAVINFVGFVVELAGGLLFGSVALMSDAMHMLFDMLAYVMAFSASYTAENFEGGERWSYGLHRLEPAAALLNGILLVPMVGYILWESYQRFLDPVSIDPTMTLIIATGGLLVNLGSVYVLQGGEMSLNERGAFYHLLGDAAGSIAVIVSAAAVAVFDIQIVDPIAAVLIAVLVLWSAGKVLWESSSILLQRSPFDIDQLHEKLLSIDGVQMIDDLHVWQVCSQLTVATVRLEDDTETFEDQQRVRQRVHELLTEVGVDHATVELTGAADIEAESATRTDHVH